LIVGEVVAARTPRPKPRVGGVTRPAIEAVLIFGSMATGDVHEESDIDLLVVDNLDLEVQRHLAVLPFTFVAMYGCQK
jgi:predicted nucleotidyltransferase